MTRAAALLALSIASIAAACSLLAPTGTTGGAAGRESAAAADDEPPSLEEEEVVLEGLDDGEPAGTDPIAELIASFATPATPAPESPASEDGHPDEPPLSGGGAAAPSAAVAAYDVWSMTDEACLESLAAAGIAVSRPDFATPFVGQPLLLDGPIDGVAIRPKWRRSVRLNEVMDCRLVAALRGVAEAAREQGIAELLFYSTYRPIQEPPADCPAGKAGRRCRAARAAWDKAKAGKASMHRRGLAIDVGWLTTADGAAVEVLSSYERHSGEPPCAAAADTDVGRRLRDFACALHARKIFNVVLTPNANDAHHNHFHFDVTPNARWYIIR